MKGTDLLGVWKGDTMGAPHARSYDVLVFKPDGTGFLDLYNADHRFTERFCWSVEPPAGLRLEGRQLMEFVPECQAFEERKTTRSAVVSFSIREENSKVFGPIRVLRLAPRPWPGMANHYLFHRRDIPMIATFQAPCFVLAEETAHSPFRGKALSDYLAQQLEARGVLVGERYEVFFGCCYYRGVQVRGRELGLAVNEDEDYGGWWLRIDRPPYGTVEAEELYRLLQDILQGVKELHSLKWQTEAEWLDHRPDSNQPGPSP
jgi:hypothetical protein